MSDFSPAFLNEIPVALEISQDDLVTKSEFDALFKQSDQIENPVGVRKKSRQLTANKRESAQEGTLAILKYLAEVI